MYVAYQSWQFKPFYFEVFNSCSPKHYEARKTCLGQSIRNSEYKYNIREFPNIRKFPNISQQLNTKETLINSTSQYLENYPLTEFKVPGKWYNDTSFIFFLIYYVDRSHLEAARLDLHAKLPKWAFPHIWPLLRRWPITCFEQSLCKCTFCLFVWSFLMCCISKAHTHITHSVAFKALLTYAPQSHFGQL